MTDQPALTPDTTPPSTPMPRVWVIVLASMTFVALFGLGWHFFILSKMSLLQTIEADETQQRITTLETYLAHLSTTSTSTLPQ